MKNYKNIKEFLESEKSVYSNIYPEDNQHLLPITLERLIEQFRDNLSQQEIYELMEQFEKEL
jgi:ubiquitin C-terminal hydrolase